MNVTDMRVLRVNPSLLNKHFKDLKSVKITVKSLVKHQCLFNPITNQYNEYMKYVKCQACNRKEYISSKEAKKLYPHLSIYWTSWMDYIAEINYLAKEQGTKRVKSQSTKRFYGYKGFKNTFQELWQKYLIGVE